MTERELHLGVNVLSAGMHPAAWQHPDVDPNWFADPAYWIEVAQIAERGTLDALFMADSPSLFQPPDEPLSGPPLALDPIVLLSSLASVTTHLGLIATVSTTFEEPCSTRVQDDGSDSRPAASRDARAAARMASGV